MSNDLRAMYAPCKVCRSLNHLTSDHADVYSRTSATDDLKARPVATDPARTFLINLGSIVGLIADHAQNAIPDTFETDPNRACIAWQTFYRFDTIGAPDKRTYRRVLESLSIQGILSVDEWEQAPLIADLLDGQILEEASAISTPDMALNTTRGHAPRVDGTYRSFRAHMPIVGGIGDTRDALELTRDADTLLAMFSPDGKLGEYALLGTQDVAPGNRAPATSDYKPNGELRKARAAGHKELVLDVERNERGQVISIRSNGANPDSMGSAHHIAPRAFRYGKDGKPPRGMVSTDIAGCFEARTHNAYRMSWNGTTWIGHASTRGTVGKRKRFASDAQTTRKARQTSKPAPESINAAHAPDRCHALAMSLYNAHIGTHSQTDNPRPSSKRFVLTTSNGLKITVGLKQGKTRPTGFDVVIVDASGKRHRTTTSAPEYVESIVRNRLALIG